jgi:DNA-binding NtrC family response regulator
MTSSEMLRDDAAGKEEQSKLRVLLVDDDRTLRDGCAAILQMDGHLVTSTGRGDEAIELVRKRRFDLVLIDLYLTPVTGMDVLRAALEANPDTNVVVMTGNPSVAASIEVLRAGASEFLPKPFAAAHLQVLVGRFAHAAQVAKGATGVIAATRTKRETATASSSTLLGMSPAFQKAVDLARKVAATDASVMISGESGTGKEMIAQFIHQHSRRANRKLIPINCAALPDNLLESEMFGYRKGAFTGADRDKAGLLEMANGGTLFLDELTEMSLPLQAKLLRVLQDGVVRRLGSEVQDAVVDVRFLSATNRDPQEAVRQGILREDLFYRLRVVPIKLPPLNARLEDIPILAEHFLKRAWDRHRDPGAAIPVLAPAAIAALQQRRWQGHVRELQNLIEHVAVLADPGQLIVPSDIPAYGDEPSAAAAPAGIAPDVLNLPFHSAKDALIADFERTYLTHLTTRTNGNLSKAARLAGIDRTTLYRLLEKHELRRAESGDTSLL